MKILHILTDTNIGGAGRYLLALLESYDRDNFQMEVVLPIGSQLAPAITALDVPVLEAQYISDRSLSAKGIGSLNHIIKERKPDLVNTHASFSGRIAAKLQGIPVIYTRHYCVPKDKSGKGKASFINNIFSSGVIATSPEVEAGLIATGTKPEHITTIYNGVPPVKSISDEEKLTLRTHYGIAPDTFVISQIARLDPVKGHDHTLDVAKLLANDPNILILLAGDGPLKDHLSRRIKEESITNVLMIGFVSEVEKIINITDLQINASYTETTSLALLEGMSLGIPAVVTNGGGNPYVISDGEQGLVVPCGDAEALAKAVLKIRGDPELYQQMSNKSLETYNKNFRADNMARQIEALYKTYQKGR
ncbi:MAG: glycosyltransferase family 4 protein [Defluviitaleaceae bacterium]|nr:glycosyltransferase family 4 protein [Defluviitaleaceae bacterium]